MNLKEMRRKSGLTQNALGKAINVRRNTICSYEKGTRKPTIESIPKIAEALGVSVADIVACFSGG